MRARPLSPRPNVHQSSRLFAGVAGAHAGQSERQQQMHTVVWMRMFAVGALALLLAGSEWLLGLALPNMTLAFILGLMAVLNLATWLRLRQGVPVGRYEVGAQLFADLAAFSLLLYFTGGVTNPFVALYLPLLGLAATLLPWRQVVLLALFSVFAYTGLMTHYMPLVLANPDDGVHFHLIGMWLNFIASVLILVVFVARLSDSVRQRNNALGLAERKLAQQSSMAALGNQAASIAHQLGTPVSTIAMVLEDWKGDSSIHLPPADVLAVGHQLKAIEETLKQLKAQVAQGNYPEQSMAQNPQRALQHCVAQWRNRNPQQEVLVDGFDSDWPAQHRVAGDLLVLGLNTLLDNAMQAQARAGSSAPLVLRAVATRHACELHLQDKGGGVSTDLLPSLGKSPIHADGLSGERSKGLANGQGIGLFLLGGLLERAGGSLQLKNEQGGLHATVVLPWQH
ncbi:MAG TPA: ATP-binding protein [Limnobacter sp.]|nr:ATP-binding protein [Limnobacter sp.]